MDSSAIRKPTDKDILNLGRKVLKAEATALESICHRLGRAFIEAIHLLCRSDGNVVVTGVGKSYFVAQKISASMASTGTPSISIHPVDGLHGDLGRVRPGDIVLALSNSGASPEIVEFLRACVPLNVQRIGITCDGASPMASLCQIVLDMGELPEACHMGVAPSTTTTAMLALGDALTITVAELKGFTLQSFAKYHPAGSLGKRLQRVEVAMRSLSVTACVGPDEAILDVLQQITRYRCGAACVVGSDGELIGVFTDGDLRRILAAGGQCLHDPVHLHMTRSPKYVSEDALVGEALGILRQYQIDELPVVDKHNILLGHIDIQDIL